MKNFPTIVVGAALLTPGICFSATVFSDNFNRAAPGSDYAVSVSAGDGGASINGSSFLELTNDMSATANANGRVSTAVSFASFYAPFSGVLSGNSGPVTWEVNLRYNRATDPSGFAGGGYGAAFVLAASQADFLGGTG
jgi:hypothetical protein